ncbi:MAG: TonB-dependent receptor [Ignavibacteriae bacterium]|nr:MAG: TonB-dependent receptor [Ignavibacteriota bacterium]
MKHFFFFLFLLVSSFIYSQNFNIKGKVVDASTKEPLIGVNIIILNSNLGFTSHEEGKFYLEGKIKKDDMIQFSYIGYQIFKTTVEEILDSKSVIELKKKILNLNRTVIVEGLIGKEGYTPASFSKVKRAEIQNDYTVQDVPEYLSYLPSTTFHTDGGNGLGYNYLNIRGFGQRRISISVNGIPQNDPEDHNVYWLDMPDLLESTELIQVQRGAGAGIIGYPSIGGSINIITSPFSDKPKFELSSSIGSYNTRKYSAKFSSGLINDKYSVYAKLSKIMSDGYRDNSWIDFNSYHVSAARYDKRLTSIINFYGGPISDGLAYYGIPKSMINDKKTRKTNYITKKEIENFSQPHYELLNELKLNDNLTLNSALFLVIGDGFFDYDGSWSIYYDDYFRLKANGYDSTKIPQNALIRAKVENKQWGWLPKLTWNHDNGTLVVGAEYRNHRSVHWGAIRYAENIPADVSPNHKYYYYKGANDIINLFVNENLSITESFNVLGEIQLAYHKYRIYEEKYLNNKFNVTGLFFNPRLGLNYKFNKNSNVYVSFARVTREPRLKNYYDAAESSGGAVPQFKQNSNGSYNFDEPLVKPEVMNDIEFGARYSNEKLSLNANLFYMMFDDEIIKSGQLDRFGQPITGNIDNTIHSGIELEGSIKFNKYLNLIMNASYSKNYVSKGNTYIKYKDVDGLKVIKQLSLKDNTIAGFPELIMNAVIRAKYNGLTGQLSAKYVGDFYSDNYGDKLSELSRRYNGLVDYTDNKVDAYFVLNFMGSYDFKINNVLEKVKIFVQVNNILDKLYATHAEGGDFFPAAERNFLMGIKLGF